MEKPERSSTPVGCGEAKVYVTDGRTNTHLHALEQSELAEWSANPVTKAEDLRIVPKGTRVDPAHAMTLEHRKFVAVAEGPYQGLFVTQSRTAAAREPRVEGVVPVIRYSRETFWGVVIVVACVAWNYPRAAIATTAGTVAAAKTGLIRWGINRLYFDHDFFEGFVMTLPIPIPYMGWSIDLSI